MDGVIEGDIHELKQIVKDKTEVEDDDFDKAAEYGFSFQTEDDLSKIKTWPEKSIGKIKDQVLAWKVINYLCYTAEIIKPNRTSSWRTNWKKVCAPHQLRQFESEKVYNGVVVKNKYGPKKEEQEQEDESLLFNWDALGQKQREIIEKLEKEKQETEQGLRELQAKLENLNSRLEHYTSVYNGSYVAPQEHNPAGGVDQGELDEDPPDEYYEEYTEEPQTIPQHHGEGEGAIEPSPLTLAPEPKKKRGRPPKGKVGEMVEKIEEAQKSNEGEQV